MNSRIHSVNERASVLEDMHLPVELKLAASWDLCLLRIPGVAQAAFRSGQGLVRPDVA